MTDLRGHIAAVASTRHIPLNVIETYADELGVPKGERADDRQLAGILARLYGWVIEQPDQSVSQGGAGATDPASGGDGGSGLPAATTPEPEGTPGADTPVVSGPATTPAGSSPSDQPVSALTIDDVLEATGGELVEDKPKAKRSGRSVEEAIADAERRAGKVTA